MVQHVWSVLCKQSIIDQETNSLSIIDVLEQMKIDVSVPSNASFPIKVPIQYQIVSMWIKHDKNKQIRADIQISIVDPEKSIVSTHTKELLIAKQIERMRSRVKISGFEVTKSGMYEFRIGIREEKQSDFRSVAELPFYVFLNKNLPKSVN